VRSWHRESRSECIGRIGCHDELGAAWYAVGLAVIMRCRLSEVRRLRSRLSVDHASAVETQATRPYPESRRRRTIRSCASRQAMSDPRSAISWWAIADCDERAPSRRAAMAGRTARSAMPRSRAETYWRRIDRGDRAAAECATVAGRSRRKPEASRRRGIAGAPGVESRNRAARPERPGSPSPANPHPSSIQGKGRAASTVGEIRHQDRDNPYISNVLARNNQVLCHLRAHADGCDAAKSSTIPKAGPRAPCAILAMPVRIE